MTHSADKTSLKPVADSLPLFFRRNWPLKLNVSFKGQIIKDFYSTAAL